MSDWKGLFAPLRAPLPNGLCRFDGPAGQVPVKTTQTHFSLRLITKKMFQLKQKARHYSLCLPNMLLYRRNNHEQSSLNSEGTTGKEILFVLEFLSSSLLNPQAPAWLPVSQSKSGVVSRLLASCPPAAKLECQIPSLQVQDWTHPASRGNVISTAGLNTVN